MKKRLRDIVYAVPTTDLYKTSAQQLSVKEVEEATNFFSKLKGYGVNLKADNPIEMPGKKLRKTKPGNPHVKSFKGGKIFRSCFYNSKYHSLEAKIGIFVSQAIHFRSKKDYNSFMRKALKDFDQRTWYAVILEKGNVHSIMNMYMPYMETSPDFLELIDFARSKGFRKIKEFNPHLYKKY